MGNNRKFDTEQYYESRKGAAYRASRPNPRITEPLKEEKGEKDRPAEQKAATYRIGQSLVDRINLKSEELQVEKTGFVKALLIYALDELDANNWELPRSGKRKLDI